MKKILSMILAIAMVLTTMGTVAFAEEEVVEPEIENDIAEDTLNPFSLIGGFFEKIGELMRIVFEFLENMFTGNGNNALEELK